MGSLKPFRDEIDALDEQLVTLLARRFAVVREVGRFKAGSDMDVVQSGRAEEVKNRVAEMARAKGLDAEFVRSIWSMMIDHAHVIEKEIKDEHAGSHG